MCNALGEVTEYVRNAGHQVTEVRVAGQTVWTGAYDPIGRLRTQTDAAGVTVSMDYDNLDRLVRITWADGTFIENQWGCCGVERFTDRMGRATHYAYNADRQITMVRDPEGRVTQFLYDPDGNLEKLLDANANPTRWEFDAENRATAKIYADGSRLRYDYDAVGRLTNMVNARGQTIRFAFDAADNRVGLYAEGMAPVITAYDALARLTNMADGVGTTRIAYLDDGAVREIDGPWANDTIQYLYDGIGRPQVRLVNGAGLTNGFDALGRVVVQSGPLGMISNRFLGASGMPVEIDYAGVMAATLQYLPPGQDRRLQSIRYATPTNQISRHDYEYAPDGQILAWTVAQPGGTAERSEFGYDNALQLTSALVRNPVDGSVIRGYEYSYDPAGNRLTELRWTAGGSRIMTTARHNVLNQVTNLNSTGAGPVRFRGRTSEAVTNVTVAGLPARLTGSNRFEAWPALGAGTNALTVTATDAQGNTATNVIQVAAVDEGERTLEYDLDGNLVRELGGRVFCSRRKWKKG